MIEIVSSRRCTGCNICVKACPANVFDLAPGKAPVIARQLDCQTCFLCEIYCPVDALYVSPIADGPVGADEARIESLGLFGSYARELRWHEGQADGTEHDPTRELRNFL